MIAFQTSTFVLITMGLMILAGNNCYSVFLRLVVWSLHKLMPDRSWWHDDCDTLRFLLYVVASA